MDNQTHAQKSRRAPLSPATMHSGVFAERPPPESKLFTPEAPGPAPDQAKTPPTERKKLYRRRHSVEKVALRWRISFQESLLLCANFEHRQTDDDLEDSDVTDGSDKRGKLDKPEA